MEAFTDQALHYQRMTFPLDSLMSGEQRQVKQGLVEQRMYREQESSCLDAAVFIVLMYHNSFNHSFVDGTFPIV